MALFFKENMINGMKPIQRSGKIIVISMKNVFPFGCFEQYYSAGAISGCFFL